MIHCCRPAFVWIGITIAAAGLSTAALGRVAAQQNPYPQQYQARGVVPGRDLTPEWTVGDLDAASVRIAPDGSCIAVLAHLPRPGRMTMIDKDGRRVWEVVLPELVVSSLAVAPGCAFVAFEATRDSDRRAVPGGVITEKGRVGIRRRDGTGVELSVDGTPDSIAISHAGDLLAVGSETREGVPNLVLATPEGRVVHASARFSYRAPQLAFSRDDRFVIVKGWYGVGVVSRAGERVWGPWPMMGGDRSSKRADWRTIDASIDLQWFAAARAPMHGPQGGAFAMLSRTGDVVWEGPPVWDPDVRIAPDGSFVVAAGREMRRDEMYANASGPVRVAVMDRTGRAVTSMEVPQAWRLECVSIDGRFIIAREAAAQGNMLVGRDRSLAAAWRLGPAAGFAVHQESGLIVAWAGHQVSAYRVPR